MKNMWQKIKRFRGWIIGCIVFLVVVQILYTIPAPSKWLEARWEAGDLISFVGTIVLGIVAIWQTKEANDMSKRLMQIEENRHKLEVRPFVMLKDWRCFYEDTFKIQAFPDQLYIYVCSSKDEPRAFCILLELTNTTEAYVSVQFKNILDADTNKSIFRSHGYSSIVNKKLRLNSGENGNMVFYGNYAEMIDTLKQKKVTFSFILENRFGERYQEDFDAVILILEHPQKDAGRLPHIIVETSNYKIGKYVNNTDGKQAVNWEDTTDG